MEASACPINAVSYTAHNIGAKKVTLHINLGALGPDGAAYCDGNATLTCRAIAPDEMRS